MKIRPTNKFKFFLVKIFSLLYILCLTNTSAYADAAIYRADDLCALKGFDCLLIPERQGQDILDVLSSFFNKTNNPLAKSNLNEICESNLQIAKNLTSSNAFKKSQQVQLDNLAGSSELTLAATESSPFSDCKVTGSNMYATLGILICALVGFVIFSNRRRV